MVRVKVIASVALACAVIGLGFHQFMTAPVKISTSIAEVKALQDQIAAIKAKEDADNKLGQYAINAMYKAGAKDKISDAKKQTLARAIVRVANDIFEKEENKRAFVTVIAIESAFQRYAQSPTGPKGYAQMARKSFVEGMQDCGVTSLKEDDVWETDLNLYAGACYFRQLLEANDDDPYMAIIAYNQGPNSDSLKSYAKSGSLNNVEALKYVAKFTFLKRTITDEQQPGVPSLKDLEKPQAVKTVSNKKAHKAKK